MFRASPGAQDRGGAPCGRWCHRGYNVRQRSYRVRNLSRSCGSAPRRGWSAGGRFRHRGPRRPHLAATSGGLQMEITEVRVFPVSEEKLKAYVTITLDHCFVVRDLKVIHGNTGLFVAMPAKRRKDGTFKDIAHPLNSETRERMERVILAEYERETSKVVVSEPRASAAGE